MTVCPMRPDRIRRVRRQRGSGRPMHVSSEPEGGARQTFAIRGHVVDLMIDGEEEEEGSK